MKLLHRFDVFQSISDPDLRQLSLYCHPKVLPRGSIIRSQGCIDRYLYFIVSGDIELTSNPNPSHVPVCTHVPPCHERSAAYVYASQRDREKELEKIGLIVGSTVGTGTGAASVHAESVMNLLSHSPHERVIGTHARSKSSKFGGSVTHRAGAFGARERELEIAVLGSGSVFGEILRGHRVVSCDWSVSAKTRTDLLYILRDDFLHHSSRSLIQRMIHRLDTQIRFHQSRLRTLLQSAASQSEAQITINRILSSPRIKRLSPANLQTR
jgi:CRP-like cAMP-binding protein